MACFHPKKNFILGTNPENGKLICKYCAFETDHLEAVGDPDDLDYRPVSYSVCRKYGTCGNKVCSASCYDVDWSQVPKSVFKVVTNYVTIPCGQCIGCRIDKSKEWAARMVMELPYSSSSWFITLTYNDEHVPRSEYVDFNGEVFPSLTLKRKDLTDFMKRLRKRFPDCNIRFYAAGEYGDNTQRPHYHAILFNCPLDREGLVPYGRSREGFTYYESLLLSRSWSIFDKKTKEYDSLGMALCSPVSYETCAYVARYCVKKLTGPAADYYDYFGIEPVFATMSRMPGLGRQWYEDNKSEDEYRTYIIRISNYNGEPLKFKPPSYFKNLYEVDYPEISEEVKAIQRKMADDRISLKLSKTDLSYLELLEIEERNFRSKVSSLKRGDVG